MAFTASQKASIKTYLGYGAIFKNNNSALDSMIESIEQLNDGGAVEQTMKDALSALATIEGQLTTMRQLTLASEVTGEVRIDAARSIAVLKSEGTRLINSLAIPLSIKPLRAYFYASDLDPEMRTVRGYF